eukprot:GHVQ01006835.1.p1 GENE.GHVQ01006835.1~~GHVQ01006835.1.p1  ORF type:complete len:802 (+),score=141.32 GHVQ01006835.1:451-2856(+)
MSSEEDLINLNIRCVDGRTVPLTVPPDLLVGDLKSLLQEALDILPGRQRLLCRGRALHDDRSLTDYDIRDGYTIHLIIRETDAPGTTSSSASSSSSSASSSSYGDGSGRGAAAGMAGFTFPGGATWTNIGGMPATVMVGQVPVGASGAGGAFFNNLINSLAHNAAMAAQNIRPPAPPATMSGTAPNSSATSTTSSTSATTSASFSFSTSSSSSPDMGTSASTSAHVPATGTGPAGGDDNAFRGFRGAYFQTGGFPLMGTGQPYFMSATVPFGMMQSSSSTVSTSSASAAGSSSGPSYTAGSSAASASTAPSSTAGTSGASGSSSESTSVGEGLGQLLSNVLRQVTGVTANATTARQTTDDTVRRLGGSLGSCISGVASLLETGSHTLENASRTTAQLGERLNAGITQRQQPTGSPSRLWLSNEFIFDRLPWASLRELQQLLIAETGWVPPPRSSMLPRFPESFEEVRRYYTAHGTSGTPLSLFLSYFNQLLLLAQTLLNHVQQWQDGTAMMGVPRIGRIALVLSRVSSVSAELSALLSHMFANMAERVSSEELASVVERWDRDREPRATATPDPEEESDMKAAEEGERKRRSEDVCEDESNRKRGGGGDRDDDSNDNGGASGDRGSTAHGSSSSSGSGNISGGSREEGSGGGADGSDVTTSGGDQQTEHAIAAMPEEVQQRWNSWTGEAATFSRSVLENARVRPRSFAYRSGDPTLPRRDREQTFSTPSSTLAVNWQEALNNLGVHDDIPVPKEPQYDSLLCSEAAQAARRNPDFDPAKHPYTTAVLSYLNSHPDYLSSSR